MGRRSLGPLAIAATALAMLAAAGLLVFGEARADAPADCFEDEPHVDVGFVLDESGSMDGDKITSAKNGATDLSSSLDDDQYSGLVSFDSSAYLRKQVGPDHDATTSAIENLTAGGSTATGDGIDLSHQDILDNGLSDGRDVMIVLADGNTNTGSDPVAEADEAKGDGIEIFAIAFGDGADEQELEQIASDPDEDYFYDASTDDIDEVFLQIAGNVTEANDTDPPTVDTLEPKEGHKYVRGQDQGPGTSAFPDRATLIGDLPFQAQADDNCYLHEVNLSVPSAGWSYDENATDVTTDAFPASDVSTGNYTLETEAMDWVGLTANESVGLHVPDFDPPAFTAGPCVTGETVEGVAGIGLSFLVEADSPEPNVTVDLALDGAPAGMVIEGELPADPARANVTWPDPDEGTYTINVEATDPLDQTAECFVDVEIANPPPVFEAPSPCVTGEAVEGFENIELAFDVLASSEVDQRNVTLAITRGPADLTLASDGPANPVAGTLTWERPTEGAYDVVIQAEDSYGETATCSVPVTIRKAPAETRAVGLWGGLTTPETVEYRSRGVHLLDPNATERHRQATVDNRSIAHVHAEGLDELGTTAYDAPLLRSEGRTEIAEVELLDGLVRAEGLVHRANLTWNVVDEEGHLADEERRIDRLEVANETIDVDDRTGPIEVDLPGDGYVRVFERELDASGDGLRYRSNLLHVYAPDAYGGEEIIVGDVHLAAPGEGYTDQPRSIADQDDADAGRDATPSDPVTIGPGLYDASFSPGDRQDAYELEAEHGDKIEVDLEPAKRVRLIGGGATITENETIVHQPGLDPELPPMEVRLFDPDGDLRAETLLDNMPTAQSLELNADENGTWTVVEKTYGFGFGPYPVHSPYTFYSFDLTLTPVLLLPQTDALSGADAPASCQAPDEAIPQIIDGQWPGVLKHDDFDDTYRFHADIGDLVTATMKPGETADGVAMDLHLYDRDCNRLASSSLGGTYTAKGLPEATVELPSQYTGSYYLRVERVNGVGNHHVTLSVRDPMPGLPTNDAHTGEDASDDPANPTRAPPAAFQGTLPEGDARDAYALSLVAEERATIALEMSALSRVDAHLYRPNGTIVTPTLALVDGTYVWSFEPAATGDHVLVVQPWSGGGDYTVAWGQLSQEALVPAQSVGLPSASTSP